MPMHHVHEQPRNAAQARDLRLEISDLRFEI
jgi:hypothetical protein